MIVAEGLTRRFRVQDRTRGLAGSLRDLVRPQAREVVAVEGLDLHIRAGEAVGLLGPNGAGKSTTVKMICGILRASEGRLRVGGLDPWADRQRHVRRLGVVFGQRTQLWWDLAVIEAFDLLAAMFQVPAAEYHARLRTLDDLLGVGAYLKTPVRQLSLGERMRCELAAALLHAPPVLVLDEPTIGLDVSIKLRMRAFLGALRDEGRTTILLTTHDLGDVVALCPRVLLLSGGRLLHDGPMADLARRLGGERRLRVVFAEPPAVARVGEVTARWPGAALDGDREMVVPLEADEPVAQALRALLADAGVADVRVEEAPLEALVARAYGP